MVHIAEDGGVHWKETWLLYHVGFSSSKCATLTGHSISWSELRQVHITAFVLLASWGMMRVATTVTWR